MLALTIRETFRELGEHAYIYAEPPSSPYIGVLLSPTIL